MADTSLVWRYTARFAVVVHTERAPSEAEWNALLDEWATRPEIALILVYTAGGVPNMTQRIRLTDTLRRRKGSVAVLTHSGLARAAVLALHVFRPEIRAFAPSELAPAFDYLGANEVERGELTRVLAELQRELGLSR